MMVYLWSDGQRDGPLLLETVHSRLLHGALPAGTLFSLGEGNDWKPLSELPALPADESPPKPKTFAEMVSAAPRVDKWLVHVERRSYWATALRVFGGIVFLATVFNGLAANAEEKPLPMSTVWGGLGAGVGLWFLAFLVDLATDIRWNLNEIREKIQTRKD